MSRQARIEAPAALHHIIIHDIEREKYTRVMKIEITSLNDLAQFFPKPPHYVMLGY